MVVDLPLPVRDTHQEELPLQRAFLDQVEQNLEHLR